jgi:hypothetical protein
MRIAVLIATLAPLYAQSKGCEAWTCRSPVFRLLCEFAFTA